MNRRVEAQRRGDFFRRVYPMIASVEGNVAECGVLYGHSLGMLANLIVQENKERHLYGFDAWAGFRTDGVPTVSWESAQHAVDAAMAASFIRGDQVTLARGWFANILPQAVTGPLAFLHLDCDDGKAYETCLRMLWPRLAKGAIVVLDEYGSSKWTLVRPTVDYFLKCQPEDGWKLVEDTRWYIQR